ncbi:uncharacterized protein A4U43_C05F19050 [Asparagus officinalis]|uniref:Uncharacterized protein n=1 Tax=Asparagus officinalis TaxID=4686 RepID=A0A5P1EV87_ASPOF|nr:uncharacterized protein A4U43_C05F19050 [Asparagus officinalis]
MEVVEVVAGTPEVKMVSLERTVIMEREEKKEKRMSVMVSKGVEVDVVSKESIEGVWKWRWGRYRRRGGKQVNDGSGERGDEGRGEGEEAPLKCCPDIRLEP